MSIEFTFEFCFDPKKKEEIKKKEYRNQHVCTRITEMYESDKSKQRNFFYFFLLVLCAIFLIILVNKAYKEYHTPSPPNSTTNTLLQDLSNSFDESTLPANVCVITFRVQSFAKEEQKARLEFLKKLHEIETQCNEREIPFQLIPKSPEPFVFVQNVQNTDHTLNNWNGNGIQLNMGGGGGGGGGNGSINNFNRTQKLYSITQDFSLPLLLARSPPSLSSLTL